MNCLDYCDDGVAEYPDPRVPPLDLGICLCKECFILALEELMEEAEERLNYYSEMINEVTSGSS